MDFLTKKIGPFPVWLWGLVVIGGVVIGGFVIPKFLGNQAKNATDQTATDAGTNNAGLPSNIDPLTGVPYDIESQVNPATGLPAYYGGAGVTNSGATTDQATLDQILALLLQEQNNQRTPPPPVNHLPTTGDANGPPTTVTATKSRVPAPVAPKRPTIGYRTNGR